MSVPRSGCPINLTLEALGDRWSLIVNADDWAIAGIGTLLVGVFPPLFDYARSTRRHVGRGGRPVTPQQARGWAGS